MLTVRLSEDLEDRLNALSSTTGKPKSWFARKAITEFIGDWEDIAEAEQRLAAIRSGKSSTRSLAEVMAEYGLED